MKFPGYQTNVDFEIAQFKTTLMNRQSIDFHIPSNDAHELFCDLTPIRTRKRNQSGEQDKKEKVTVDKTEDKEAIKKRNDELLDFGTKFLDPKTGKVVDQKWNPDYVEKVDSLDQSDAFTTYEQRIALIYSN